MLPVLPDGDCRGVRLKDSGWSQRLPLNIPSIRDTILPMYSLTGGARRTLILLLLLAASLVAQEASAPVPGVEAEENEEGGFVFRSQVEEVVLYATVADRRQKLVTGLGREAFRVFENGVPQPIHSFAREDVPVALAIVVDNSASMASKRAAVASAALNLIRAGNPEDEVCVINFNGVAILDQDFTADIGLLQAALNNLETRGPTALYDAVAAAGKHLMKASHRQKKVILMVTDGEDTASRLTLERAVRLIAVEGGPAVYAIGIMGGGQKPGSGRRALRRLAEQSGGAAYFPGRLDEVEEIARQIARDIRGQYMIGYRPSLRPGDRSWHEIRVTARARGWRNLTVRTRSGYYAGGPSKAQAEKAPAAVR